MILLKKIFMMMCFGWLINGSSKENFYNNNLYLDILCYIINIIYCKNVF